MCLSHLIYTVRPCLIHSCHAMLRPCRSSQGHSTARPFPCRAGAVTLACRAAKCLECVFPIWFTQCGRVWFTVAMPCSDHAVLLKVTAQHGRLLTAVLYCSLEKNGMVGAWHGHGMETVNQTWPHCVNQMGKTHSKPLAAQHGRGTACYVWISLITAADCADLLLTYSEFTTVL